MRSPPTSHNVHIGKCPRVWMLILLTLQFSVAVQQVQAGSAALEITSISDAPDPFAGANGAPWIMNAQVRYPVLLPSRQGGVLSNESDVYVLTELQRSNGATVQTLASSFPADRRPGQPVGNAMQAVTQSWNGTGSNGLALPPGMYNYTVRAYLVETLTIRVLRFTIRITVVLMTSSPRSGTVEIRAGDTQAPTITPLAPADGAWLAQSQPEISAAFADAGSGVNPASVSVWLDGVARSVSANAGGFSFTPPAPLSDGRHDVRVELRDLAGNPAAAQWSFHTDTADPVVSGVLPAADAWTNSRSPALAANFGDPTPGSGIDPASIRVFLDDADLSASATASGFAFNAPVPLVDGPHTLLVQLADRVGHAVTVSQRFNVDATAPVFTDLAPANGALVPDGDPVLSGSFSDGGSGIDASSFALRLNGSPIAATLGPDRFTHTPLSWLEDGLYQAEAEVRDAAGNRGLAAWSFRIDTRAPVITDLMPAGGGCTNDPRPVFSAVFGDAETGSGIDPARTRVLLNGLDVTEQAQVLAGGFVFQPAEPLLDGVHGLRLEIYDRAGHSAAAETSVEVDTTPPPAPVIDQVVRTADRVTVSGDSPHDVVAILATADGAIVESAIIASFVVVFAKDGQDTFDFTLRFRDCAGNVGPATSAQESFLTDPSGPPLEFQSAGLLIPAGKKRVDRNGTMFTNSTTITARFALSGGTAPYFATVNGIEAEPVGTLGAVYEVTFAGLPEGAHTFTLQATDAADRTVETNLEAFVDLTPPVLRIRSATRTFPLDHLITNQAWRFCEVSGEAGDDASGPATVQVDIFCCTDFELRRETLILDPANPLAWFATSVGIGGAERQYPVTVRLFDALGNSVTQSFAIELDTHKPGVDPFEPGAGNGHLLPFGHTDGWLQTDTTIWGDANAYIPPDSGTPVATIPLSLTSTRYLLVRREQSLGPVCVTVPVADLAGNTGDLIVHFEELFTENITANAASPLVLVPAGPPELRRDHAEEQIRNALRLDILDRAVFLFQSNSAQSAAYDLSMPVRGEIDNTHSFLTRGQLVFLRTNGNPDTADIHNLNLEAFAIDGLDIASTTRWLGPPLEIPHTLSITARVTFDGADLTVTEAVNFFITASGPGPAFEDGVPTFDRASRVSPGTLVLPREDEDEKLVEVFIAAQLGSSPESYFPYIDGLEVVSADGTRGSATVRLMPSRGTPNEEGYVEGSPTGLLPVMGTPEMLNVVGVRPSHLEPGTKMTITISGGDLPDANRPIGPFDYADEEDLWTRLERQDLAGSFGFERSVGDLPPPGADSAIEVLRVRVRKDPRVYTSLGHVDLEVLVGADVPQGLYDLVVPLKAGGTLRLPQVLRVP